MTIQKSLITWRLDHYITLNDTFGEGEYQSNIYIQGGVGDRNFKNQYRIYDDSFDLVMYSQTRSISKILCRS